MFQTLILRLFIAIILSNPLCKAYATSAVVYYTIKDLDETLLDDIFSYFSEKELRPVRLVSKQWHSISQSKIGKINVNSIANFLIEAYQNNRQYIGKNDFQPYNFSFSLLPLTSLQENLTCEKPGGKVEFLVSKEQGCTAPCNLSANFDKEINNFSSSFKEILDNEKLIPIFDLSNILVLAEEAKIGNQNAILKLINFADNEDTEFTNEKLYLLLLSFIENKTDKTLNNLISYYKKLAKKGQYDANIILGSLYFYTKDYLKAFQYYKKSKDIRVAQRRLGEIYERGLGQTECHDKAIKWYKRAVTQEDNTAKVKLATLYLLNPDKDPDFSAKKLLNQAARQEHPAGYFTLGTAYENGLGGFSPNLQKAIKFYKLAAKYGHPKAQNRLGELYMEIQNYEVARHFFLLASAQDNIQACLNLGHLSISVSGNIQEAEDWYSRAAEKNLHTVSFEASLVHFHKDLHKAILLYQVAAKYGDKKSQYALGDIYLEGLGVEADAEKAFSFYKQAADQGLLAAQLRVAHAYKNGIGTEKHEIKAFDYFLLAAKQGDLGAHEQLELLKKAGVGTLKKLVTTSKLPELPNDAANVSINEIGDLIKNVIEETDKKSIKKKAEEGEPISQVKRGILYEYGEVNQLDLTKAIEWYEESMQRNCKLASLVLAETYIKHPSIVEAKLWFFHALIKLPLKDLNQKLLEQSAIENPPNQNYWIYKNYKDCIAMGKECLQALGTEYSPAPRLFSQPEEVRLSPLSSPFVEITRLATNVSKGLLGLDLSYSVQILQKNNISTYWQEDFFKYVDSARLDNLFALYNLGNILMKLDKYIEDELICRKSIFIDLYKNMSAQENSKGAQYMLGQLYRTGYGVEKDETEALNWYHKAATQDHAEAQYQLASLILNKGEEIEVVLAWYNRSAKQGYPYAYYVLGLIYANGIDVIQDTEKALAFYTKAATEGNEESRDILIDLARENHQQAQAILGQLYADILIERSLDTTDEDVFQWLTAAGDQGNIKTLYRLGRMHEYGWGTLQDDVKAVTCYKIGAKKGYIPAQKALAEMYREGRGGLKKSTLKSLKWYRCAAKQDDIGATAALKAIVDEFMDGQALYALGRAYEEGWGIAREEDEAITYYTTSANQGYPKAQYIVSVYRLKDKIKDTEFDPILQLVFLSGKEATDSYFKLIGKKPNYKQKKHIKRLMDFDYGSYYNKGYYKAQHKLAELYETGIIIPLINAKNPVSIYEESMRLYEAAIKSEKPVPLAPLERVKRSLTLFKRTEHQRLCEQEPKFDKLIKKSSGANNLSSKFLYQLYTLYTRSNELSGKVGKELKNIIIRLASLSESNKQAQGMLSMVSTLVSSAQFDQQKNQIIQLKKVCKNFDTITRPWYSLNLPSSIPPNLRISTAMIQDPRIEIFNAYFKPSEEDYDSYLFNCAINKILGIFDRLINQGEITNEALQSEADREAGDVIEKGSRDSLKKLLTANNSSRPNNRFAHRLIHISDMVYEQFRKDPALTATQLIQWAKRGVNCLTAGEYEMDTFYTEYVINVGMNSSALSRQEHTLEMQVAISLAKLRGKILEELVDPKEPQSIHSLTHLKRRSRIHLGLLGDAENYIDVSEESTINSQYLAMTPDDILVWFKEKYTPDFIAQHIAQEIDNQNIDYRLIIRRLKLQYIQAHFKSKGIEDDLFEKEDHLLERWTKAEIYDHIAKAISKNKGNQDAQENYEDILEWDKFNKQAEEYAIVQMRKNFYDENYHFTPLAAKALLYSLKYIEEES